MRSEAASLLEQALAETEQAVGSDHPDLIFILENYSIVLAKTGGKAEALRAADRARNLRRAFAWQANANSDTIAWTDLR